MPSLDARIDELYKSTLADFVAARNTLTKTLTGADAKTVKALKKPGVVPWAVNQLYWRARPIYDRLMKSGRQLRAAQISGLEGKAGKPADIRAASETHRHAL